MNVQADVDSVLIAMLTLANRGEKLSKGRILTFCRAHGFSVSEPGLNVALEILEENGVVVSNCNARGYSKNYKFVSTKNNGSVELALARFVESLARERVEKIERLKKLFPVLSKPEFFSKYVESPQTRLGVRA